MFAKLLNIYNNCKEFNDNLKTFMAKIILSNMFNLYSSLNGDILEKKKIEK